MVAIKGVTDAEDLMIINKSGIVIRIAVEGLRVMGRATQGVRLINLKDNDEIASITKVDREEESDEESGDIENPTEGDNEGSASEENIDSNEE
ncbi:DNA gyrase subunit A [compost metagenome]